MKNIFIAGGAGHIGSACTEYKLDHGYRGTVFGSPVTGKPIPAGVVPRRPGDPSRLIACSDLARKELGWQPQFENAEAIIQSVWSWMAKFPDGNQDC